jgi:hypothetical protein
MSRTEILIKTIAAGNSSELINILGGNQGRQIDFIRISKITRGETIRNNEKIIADIDDKEIFECLDDNKQYSHEEILELFRCQQPAAVLIYLMECKSDKTLPIRYEGQGVLAIIIKIPTESELAELSQEGPLHPIYLKEKVRTRNDFEWVAYN